MHELDIVLRCPICIKKEGKKAYFGGTARLPTEPLPAVIFQTKQMAEQEALVIHYSHHHPGQTPFFRN